MDFCTLDMRELLKVKVNIVKHEHLFFTKERYLQKF